MQPLLHQLFFLKKSKSEKRNVSTIYLRITINGVRTEFSTQRQCDAKKWSSKAGRMMGKTEETKTLNSYLDAIEHRIYAIHTQLLSANKAVTGVMIKAEFLGTTLRPQMLVEVYQYHNQQLAALVGKDFAPGTLKKFRTALTSLQSFIQWKFHKADIAIKELNYQFITEYEFYLKSIQGLQHNSAMGIIKKLKKIIRQCVANEWLDKDPFTNYKVKIQEKNRAYLLEVELHALAEKPLEVERLSQVRDLFLFSCFTGLSYSDVAKLTKKDTGNNSVSAIPVSDEQKEIRRLQKQLREAQKERDTLKKQSSIFSKANGSYSNL